jgi:hypothetical protein
MDLTQKKRYLTKAQCLVTAARFSQEMREDQEGREKWGDEWVCGVPVGDPVDDGSGRIPYIHHRQGKKPINLFLPGDLEEAKLIIERLYHPEEAAIIIEHLTDGEVK